MSVNELKDRQTDRGVKAPRNSKDTNICLSVCLSVCPSVERERKSFVYAWAVVVNLNLHLYTNYHPLAG